MVADAVTDSNVTISVVIATAGAEHLIQVAALTDPRPPALAGSRRTGNRAGKTPAEKTLKQSQQQ